MMGEGWDGDWRRGWVWIGDGEGRPQGQSAGSLGCGKDVLQMFVHMQIDPRTSHGDVR